MHTPEAFLVKLAMQSAATWHALGPRIFPGEMTVETDGSVYRFSAGLLVGRTRRSGDTALSASMRDLRLIGFLAEEESGLYSFSPRFREGAHAVLWKPDPSVALDESAFILTSPARSATVEDPRRATPASGVMRVARARPTVPRPQPSSVTRLHATHCAR